MSGARCHTRPGGVPTGESGLGYSRAVGVAAVRELEGTMEGKHASKGIMVTTSWVTKGGHEHARRHGRMQIIECDNLTHMLKEHLGMDVIISLPKGPHVPHQAPNPRVRPPAPRARRPRRRRGPATTSPSP
ncbi:restriction endonuclease [Nocardiopsis salina]|uniref:restriction endonuclease n=1 Tax=Nocardiopsis salina TaxID=245836 RepID=UPI001377BD6D